MSDREDIDIIEQNEPSVMAKLLCIIARTLLDLKPEPPFVVTAKDVRALRDRTGDGIHNCKDALTKARGDMDKAAEDLRTRGFAIGKR